MRLLFSCFLLVVTTQSTFADADYELSLRRSLFLLNGKIPSEEEIADKGASLDKYRSAVRTMVDDPNFYRGLMRYHERVFGVGLNPDYLEEFENDDLDRKRNKVASITCSYDSTNESNRRYRCEWSTEEGRKRSGACPKAWEEPVSVFWYQGLKAWVCPSIRDSCGSDLSRCFITHANKDEATNSEVGSTEVFDSSVAIMRSLSKQAAGIAASVAYYNYPYTKVLEPGLTAVDGAISHMHKQGFHFSHSKLHIPADVIGYSTNIRLNKSRFQLINIGKNSEQAGVLSSFGWLRRYEKNRSRANQLYQRLMCRKFTADLPRVFPQDPGNLRTTAGCSGCHATLDPLADFFKVWGEGGSLYGSSLEAVSSSFSNKSGTFLADLAEIIRSDGAFSTCTVQNVWKYLMGREFYTSEAKLRQMLTSYFVTTNYSLKELFYAVATHPAFVEGKRSDGAVGDPLADPPLGENPPAAIERTCQANISFATDIQSRISVCTNCHSSSNTARQALETEAQWRTWRSQAVSFMSSGQMPPGQAGPPVSGSVFDLKELVRCWTIQSP